MNLATISRRTRATSDKDIVLGCRVFTDAVASIALAAADADAAGSSGSSEHAAKL
jgi:hypothetical protein